MKLSDEFWIFYETGRVKNLDLKPKRGAVFNASKIQMSIIKHFGLIVSWKGQLASSFYTSAVRIVTNGSNWHTTVFLNTYQTSILYFLLQFFFVFSSNFCLVSNSNIAVSIWHFWCDFTFVFRLQLHHKHVIRHVFYSLYWAKSI